MNNKLLITGTSRDIGEGLAKVCNERNIDDIEINREQKSNKTFFFMRRFL